MSPAQSKVEIDEAESAFKCVNPSVVFVYPIAMNPAMLVEEATVAGHGRRHDCQRSMCACCRFVRSVTQPCRRRRLLLRRFLPDAQIDILLEDWVAPLLDGFDAVDNVISVGKGSAERLKTAWNLRRRGYDVAFNLHGGTTATFFTAASRARHRVGFADYQYSFLYNHLLSSASDFWGAEFTHSAEQQLALLGFVGVPVEDRPKSSLTVSQAAVEKVRTACVSGWNDDGK